MATPAPWAWPYEPGPAERAFRLLGAKACAANVARCTPPSVDVPITDREWYFWAVHASYAPPALVVLGLIVALCAVFQLCRPSGARPAPKAWTLAMACLLLVLAWAGAGLSIQSGLRRYAYGAEHFRLAVGGFRQAEEALAYAGNATARLIREVGGLTEACHGLREILTRSSGPDSLADLERFQESAADDLREYGKQIAGASPKIMALRPPLESLGPRAQAWPAFLAYCFVTPAQLAAFCAFGMVVLAVARGFTSRGGGILDAILLWLGSVCLAVLMVVVTAASAAMLGMGVNSGSFCVDPGTALLGVLQTSADPAPTPGALNAARYYLAAGGVGAAPAAAELAAARHRIRIVQSTMADSQRHLNMLALVCDPVQRMDLKTSVAHLENTTDEVIQLLSKDAVYDHYDQVVNRVVCGSALEALGWLTIFQVLIGLVCLPLISVLAHSFMRDIGEGAGKHFEPCPTDEYSRSAEPNATVRGRPDLMPGALGSAVLESRLGSGPASGFEVMQPRSPLGSGIGQAMHANGASNRAPMHSFPTELGSYSPMASNGLPGGRWPAVARASVPEGLASPRGERRVHFADERGGSLFGSQNLFASQKGPSSMLSTGGGQRW